MTFSLTRFISVVKLDLATRMRKISFSILALLAMTTIIDVAISISNRDFPMSEITDTLGDINIFISMACMLLVASIAFKDTGEKAVVVNLLMLPASTWEKWLTRWLLAVPVATAVIMAVLCLADIISSAIWCTTTDYPEIGPIGIIPYLKSMTTYKYLCFVALLQSVFFLGSLLWPGMSWAKTTLALTGFGLLAFSILLPLHAVSYRDMWVAGLPVAIIIYIISYFRLKEAEIINHW